MPAVQIVTEEDVPSVPTTVHTSATRTWTLSGDYGTGRNDRHMADPVRLVISGIFYGKICEQVADERWRKGLTDFSVRR